LIGQDIINYHSFDIDNDKDKLYIGSCDGACTSLIQEAIEVPQEVEEGFSVERERKRLKRVAAESHQQFV